MVTVNLKSDLAEQIVQLTDDSESTTEMFVNEAVREYIVRLRREKIRAETRAFEQQRDHLIAEYGDQYVAIHEGRVIDHDPDLRTLHRRVFERLGRTPVLLKKVTADPTREYI